MKKTLCLWGLLALVSNGLYAQAQKVDTLRLIELEEVSISATKVQDKTPMSYTNLSKKEIKKTNLGQDLPFLLQAQPSVLVASDAGTGVGYTSMRVRGVGVQGINVMVNGIPLNDSESQGVWWVNMANLAGSMQEIQLQRGVGTSTNGAGAFGASLNMKTENIGLKPETQVELGLGSYGFQKQCVRISSGRLQNKWFIDGRFSRMKGDGYVDRATFDGIGYFVQGTYLGDKTMLKLLSFGGKQQTGVAWNGLDPNDEKQFGRQYNSAGIIQRNDNGTALTYNGTDNYRQLHNQLIWSYKLPQNLSLNFTGHYTRGFGFTDDYQNGWDNASGEKLKKYNLNEYYDASGKLIESTALIRQKYLDNHFVGGIFSLNWKLDKLRLDYGLATNYYIGKHYGNIKWLKNYNQAVDPKWKFYNDLAQKTEASTFIKANYEIFQGLNAYLDLQYRYINYKINGVIDRYDKETKTMREMNLVQNFNFFNPKFGLFYRFNAHHEAYTSVAVANREPNRDMFTFAPKNELPRPERLIDYELGYSFKTAESQVSANFYYMHYNDQLVKNGKKGPVGKELMENVAKSYRLGLEISASYQPLEWLAIQGNLALSKSQIKDYVYYSEKWDGDYMPVKSEAKDTPIAYNPNIITSGAIKLSKWGAELTWTANYVGKQHLDNTGSEARTLKAYCYSNLLASYKLPFAFFTDTRLSLQVNNLFNNVYANNAYAYYGLLGGEEVNTVCTYPQAPTNILLGLSITL